MSDPYHRCVGCGKVILHHTRAARIELGPIEESGFKSHNLWGFMHHSCFSRAIGDTSATLDELRRLAKS